MVTVQQDRQAAGHTALDQLACALQEQRFVGGHLVEDDLLDRRLAAPVSAFNDQ